MTSRILNSSTFDGINILQDKYFVTKYFNCFFFGYQTVLSFIILFDCSKKLGSNLLSTKAFTTLSSGGRIKVNRLNG